MRATAGLQATSKTCQAQSCPARSATSVHGQTQRGSRMCAVACQSTASKGQPDRRALNMTLISIGLGLALNLSDPGSAKAGYKEEIQKRRRKIPEEEYTDGPNGLKLYDIIVGTGAEAAVGQRVAVHYDVKFRNITFITSRMGLGVTGGTPVGFNIGVPSGTAGSTLKGIDLGVRGMRVGGLRRLLVPPELAYGKEGVGEIPGGATLSVDVELLSIKTSPTGFRTKLVEG